MATLTWTGDLTPSGVWSVGANWTGDVTPGTLDDVFINRGLGAPYTVTYDLPSGLVSSLTVGNQNATLQWNTAAAAFTCPDSPAPPRGCLVVDRRRNV